MAALAPEAIVRALTTGAMREQGSALTSQEKQSVAEFLTQRRMGTAEISAPAMCAANEGWFDYSQLPELRGWGMDASNSHAIPDHVAWLDRDSLSELTLKWVHAFPNVLYARSQPAFAGGTIFVGGDDAMVYALDPESGCAHWRFAASGPVRMGIVAQDWDPGSTSANPLLFFGDVLGNAYAIEATSGDLVWKRLMDEHPSVTLTGSPALNGDVLYVPVSSLEEPAAAAPGYACCTFRGSLAALDAETGEEKWRAYMVDQPQARGTNAAGNEQFGPSGVAIWSAPLVDAARGQVYVVTGDNYSSPATELSDAIVALDLETGRVNWSYQATIGDAWNVACGWVETGNCPEEEGPDFDFGAAPVLAKDANGSEYLLAGQKSGAVYAVDPDDGSLVWSRKVGRGGALGGVHFGIAVARDKVIVPISDFPDGVEHDSIARPGLYALDLSTGETVWAVAAADSCGGKRFCQPGYAGAVSVTDQLVLAGSTDGFIRIYDVENGALLWDYDTDRDFETTNGGTGHGGSMSGGSAPIMWHGMLIVSSGYGGLGKMPGNVMLVFDRD
jgi:polyvinyl alcohol dehydrogenase (cytochrome)